MISLQKDSIKEMLARKHQAWGIYLRIDSKARFTSAFARSIL